MELLSTASSLCVHFLTNYLSVKELQLKYEYLINYKGGLTGCVLVIEDVLTHLPAFCVCSFLNLKLNWISVTFPVELLFFRTCLLMSLVTGHAAVLWYCFKQEITNNLMLYSWNPLELLAGFVGFVWILFYSILCPEASALKCILCSYPRLNL